MNLRMALSIIAAFLIFVGATTAQQTPTVYPPSLTKSVGKRQMLKQIEVTETLLDEDVGPDFDAAISGEYVTFTTGRAGSFNVINVTASSIPWRPDRKSRIISLV